MTRKYLKPLRSFAKSIELVKNTDAASGKGGECCTSYAKFGKRAKTEDKAGIEYQVEYVRDPKQTHGNRSVTSAAKDSVVKEEHQNNTRAAECNSSVVSPAGDDRRGCTHQSQQSRCEHEKGEAKRD